MNGVVKIIKSTVAITYELDDLVSGAAELADGIQKNLQLKGNSLGILLCDSDADHDAFVREIRKRLDIPIVGYVCTAMFTNEDDLGLVEDAASLTVVTADDVHFSIGSTEPLTLENASGQIASAYKRALASLDGEPAFVLAFPPYILGIMLDIYSEELDKASGGLPVFGGLPAHDEKHGKSAVFCGKGAAPDRLAIVLVSGNVKPVFSVKNSLSSIVNIKRTVTDSKNNTVYRVGDTSFVEFLGQFGLDVAAIADAEDKTTSFTTYPLLVERENDENFDGIAIVRTLHTIDMERGSGTAIGAIPQGSTLSLGILRCGDIEVSAKKSVADILEKMRGEEDEGYEYSTILAVSCVGRYFVMAGRNTLESDILLNGLPPNLKMTGFYSFGEICPTSVRDNSAVNAAHNESLVLMAI